MPFIEGNSRFIRESDRTGHGGVKGRHSLCTPLLPRTPEPLAPRLVIPA